MTAPADVIARALDSNHGLALFTMGQLRDIHAPSRSRGSEPLSAQISSALSSQGIHHLPADLPTHEDNSVVLYRSAGLIGHLIAAAHLSGPYEDPASAFMPLLAAASMLNHG
ncbi:hypothetical protein ACFV3E_41770 [Streptomyces sp. NPDC059718]